MPAGEVVGGDGVGEVLPELVMALVVEVFDRGILDGAVHALPPSYRSTGAWALVMRCSLSLPAQVYSKA